MTSLLRFEHCGRFVFTDAGSVGSGSVGCPLCQQPLQLSLLDAPVRVPCPFTDGHRTCCCLVISSRLGPSGFSDEDQDELHVGLSNSAGVVYSYTQSGVQRQCHGWEQSLVIHLVAPSNCHLSFRMRWDRELETFSSLDMWVPHRFQEDREFGSCCYGFTLSFINQLMRSEGNEPISRQMFTTQYVLPRIRTASKYLSIYQVICQQGYYSTTVL
ncbi:MKRN2 opposite strand protein [Thalassophryne amazonica]|uniref:MKRN2 opposite strand protein n=1 Tax=Thalassophryne amazonica TaxID=390379 RepID=UPI001470BAD0|nr:MKRN2 opposite strand protein [Thalassophryne amazonica]